MELRLDTGYRQILKMALPISLAMLVPQINFITNNIFLGGLGERQLASAGITGVFYLIFAVIGNGLNNGLQSLIARRAGQNLPKEIGRLFYNGVWVALGIAAIGVSRGGLPVGADIQGVIGIATRPLGALHPSRLASPLRGVAFAPDAIPRHGGHPAHPLRTRQPALFEQSPRWCRTWPTAPKSVHAIRTRPFFR